MIRFARILSLSLLALAPTDARAAEVTEIWSPFAGGAETLGLTLGLGFTHETTDVKVDRDQLCLAHATAGGESLCPEGSRVVSAKDLDAALVESTLALDFRLAFWRSIEARVNVPILLYGGTNLSFAAGVDGGNSTTAPYNGDQVFEVPNSSGSRAGIGDPVLGLWGAPLSSARDPSEPDLLLGLELVLPLAEPRAPGRGTIGQGIFGVTVSVAGSARVVSWLEPFAKLSFALQLGASNDLYPDFGNSQTVSGPPQRLGFLAGLEFVPWERPVQKNAVRIEVGGGLELVTAGVAPTVLFDAIGTSACSDATRADPCALTTTASGRYASGTTVEEEHLSLSSWLAVHYDVFETLRVSARASFIWRTPHYLTFSDIGADTDGDDLVERVNDAGDSEFDPSYVPTWDDPGGRFRAASNVTLGMDFVVMTRF